jgi:flagellar biosynthesis chaperone FliJ
MNARKAIDKLAALEARQATVSDAQVEKAKEKCDALVRQLNAIGSKRNELVEQCCREFGLEESQLERDGRAQRWLSVQKYRTYEQDLEILKKELDDNIKIMQIEMELENAQRDVRLAFCEVPRASTSGLLFAHEYYAAIHQADLDTAKARSYERLSAAERLNYLEQAQTLGIVDASACRRDLEVLKRENLALKNAVEELTNTVREMDLRSGMRLH